jgi:hypothetical protein
VRLIAVLLVVAAPAFAQVQNIRIIDPTTGKPVDASTVNGKRALQVDCVQGCSSSGGGSTGGLTNTELRATPVPVSGTVTTSPSGTQTVSGTVTVTDGSGPVTVDGTVGVSGSVAVTGTFWQTTQPVSGPLTDTQLRATAVPVSGTFWQSTQPISAISLPLPAGAATSAKQPALGTAGSASADVLTVQGVASMTALKVDGSAVTQPVSGTVTANQGGAPWSVGGTQANNAAITANPVLVGIESLSTQPAAATTGNIRRAVGGLDGVQYFRNGGPVTWSCSLDAIGATLTQCQAAPGAGLRLYVTDIVAQSTTATAGQFLLRQGTGTNCGTGTASLLPAAATVARLAAPANSASPSVMNFTVGIPATAANAICVLGVATNTTTIQISGYTAP